MHDVIITQVEQRYLKERCKMFLMGTITSSLNHCTTKGLLLNFRARETEAETQTYSFLFQRICFLLLLRILT